jgi:hypothetical protein
MNFIIHTVVAMFITQLIMVVFTFSKLTRPYKDIPLKNKVIFVLANVGVLLTLSTPILIFALTKVLFLGVVAIIASFTVFSVVIVMDVAGHDLGVDVKSDLMRCNRISYILSCASFGLIGR